MTSLLLFGLTEGIDELLIEAKNLGQLSLSSNGRSFPVKLKERTYCSKWPVADKTRPRVYEPVTLGIVVGRQLFLALVGCCHLLGWDELGNERKERDEDESAECE
jgi:hypothetical protein